MTETPSYTAASSPSSGRLWYGMTAGMAAWILQGISGFVIADAACSGHSMSVGSLQLLLVVISLAMLVVAVSAAVVAWRTWRSLATAEFTGVQAPGRGEFMAVAGILISVVFSIAIVWGGLAPLLTGLCEARR